MDFLTVQAQVLTCEGCELHKQCRQPIPLTTKSSSPSFIVLGEAPGRWEDRRGEPFVGETGQLLRATLKHVGVNPDDGAYMNTVSCWPKNDHNPQSHHIEACKGNLFDQLRVFDAKYVLVCGRVAVETLLPRLNPARARGRAIPWHDKILFPIYHPSYIQRSGSRTEYELWKRELNTFRLLMLGWNTHHTDCVYCGRVGAQLYDDVIYLCKKHLKTFRKDQEWHPPKLPEPSLFPIETIERRPDGKSSKRRTKRR